MGSVLTMPRRDTRTRWQGVFARHQEGCGVERLPAGSALGGHRARLHLQALLLRQGL